MSSAQRQRLAAMGRAHELVETIHAVGAARPLREIAEELMRRGVPTAQGGQWHPQMVARLLRRLGLSPGIELGAAGLRLLQPGSVDAIVTSPPYAGQRQRQYGGVKEADYPDWTVRWMDAARPALKPLGSVAIVIRPHVKDGQISDYVLRTRLAVRAAGWFECDELIWIKPSAPPLGHNKRPRRSWESILWFSPSRRPYCDPKAGGAVSERLGLHSRRGMANGTIKPSSPGLRSGVARGRDYVEVGTGSCSPAIDHPAQFPVPLAEWLIRLLCPAGGTVHDPYVGSGSTALAARNAGRRCIGHDVNPDYVEIAARRLRSPVQPLSPCHAVM